MLDPVLQALEDFGRHAAQRLEFNTAYLSDTTRAIRDELLLSQSIHNRIPHYFGKIARVMSTILPEAQVIRELRFANINVEQRPMTILAQALAQPSSVRTVEFDHVDVGDKTGIAFFQALGLSIVEHFAFRNCKLTDDVIDSVLAFLQRLIARRGRGSLPSIDLSGNLISEYSFAQLEHLMTGKPLPDRDDGSSDEGGKATDSSLIGSPSAASEGTDPDDDEVAQLFAENERLRRQIARLKEILQDVREKDAIVVIGDGSDKLFALMDSIDRRIESLAASAPPPTPSKQTDINPEAQAES
jgi:hypothetical protein